MLDVRVAGLVIEGQVWLAAPAERVFDALTTPEWLAAWWGDDDAYTTHDWQIAAVEGTAWRCEIVTRHGVRHSLGGQVLSVQRPRALRLSWQPSWQPELCTEVCFELAAREGGTLLSLRHTGFRPDFTGLTTHASGWPWVLGWLAQALEQRR
ncbi:MAG: SRPBCC domain-containing protein [Pseudomonadota bacterium]